MRAPDAGTPQRELQPATIREMPGDSPNNGELAPLYRINDSCCASLFYRLPTGGSDLEANGLDRLAAAYHGISLCPHEPIAHKLKQFRREPGNKKWINAAVLSRMGEHFERLALSMAHCEADDTEYSTPGVIRTTPWVLARPVPERLGDSALSRS